MKVDLVRHTLTPEELISLGARLCYSKTTLDDLQERIASRDQAEFIRNLKGMGHDSVLEHASFTFGIEGVSRVLLAQITRHRLASFSVQSQRYCGVDPTDVVIPQSIVDKRFAGSIKALLRHVNDVYQAMVQEGVPEEDARYFTFQAGRTRFLVTMNVRELRHFFALRTCNRAQWEIRYLADEMLRICKETAPLLFDDAGCACMVGKPCPEGKKSCGKPRMHREVER